jgi:hypothetical protein
MQVPMTTSRFAESGSASENRPAGRDRTDLADAR